MDTTVLLDTPRTAAATAGVEPHVVESRDVLVAIPVLNEEAHIDACVRSLMRGDRRLAEAEFVIIDGGSTDRTRSAVADLLDEFSNIRLLYNPKRLQSAAVNLAARECGHGRRILVRCDAHSIYPPGYVMAVADSLNQRGVASVVVPMDAIGRTCFQRANAWIVDTPLGSGGSAHRGGKRSMFVDHGHHAGFDLKTFLHVGGYDETFSHNEDAEFDKRLRDAGGRIFLDADIRLKYYPRADARTLARQYFDYGKGRARTILKHGERPRLRQMIPLFTLAACVLGVAVAPFTLWGLALPAGYLTALALASLAIAIKNVSLCGLLAGCASAVMHMSWAAGFFRQLVTSFKQSSENRTLPLADL
jgi:succinoglycan biosynthesis protein ExoA